MTTEYGGLNVLDADGNSFGKVEETYYDSNNAPRFVGFEPGRSSTSTTCFPSTGPTSPTVGSRCRSRRIRWRAARRSIRMTRLKVTS